MSMTNEEIKHTRELATALIFAMKGFGMNPPAETSIPHRLLMLCNEVERLDRAFAEAGKAIPTLRDALSDALELVEEMNGDPSDCSHNVPIGELAIELRKLLTL